MRTRLQIFLGGQVCSMFCWPSVLYCKNQIWHWSICLLAMSHYRQFSYSSYAHNKMDLFVMHQDNRAKLSDCDVYLWQIPNYIITMNDKRQCVQITAITVAFPCLAGPVILDLSANLGRLRQCSPLGMYW